MNEAYLSVFLKSIYTEIFLSKNVYFKYPDGHSGARRVSLRKVFWFLAYYILCKQKSSACNTARCLVFLERVDESNGCVDNFSRFRKINIQKFYNPM